MKTTEQVIYELNEAKISQTSIDFEEDLTEEQIADLGLCVAGELERDQHRWYDLSIDVYHRKEDDKYIGVLHVSNLYSESSSVDDLGFTLEFFEMYPVTVVTYATEKPE